MCACVCGGCSLKSEKKKKGFSRRASEQESAQASSQQGGGGGLCLSAGPAEAGGYIQAVRHGRLTVPGMEGKKNGCGQRPRPRPRVHNHPGRRLQPSRLFEGDIYKALVRQRRGDWLFHPHHHHPCSQNCHVLPGERQAAADRVTGRRLIRPARPTGLAEVGGGGGRSSTETSLLHRLWDAGSSSLQRERN